jgi:hypothetical protein
MTVDLGDFGIAVPNEIHPERDVIASNTQQWAQDIGLVTGEQRFAHVAAHTFPHQQVEDVALFAKWVTWFFGVDDRQDSGVAGSDTVDRTYDNLLGIVAAAPDVTPNDARSDPLERGLADLWRCTYPRMSTAWHQRFHAHMRRHKESFVQQQEYRRTGATPSVAEYPDLRRRANGEHMWDLFEVVCRHEVPARLADTDAWVELAAASDDITAWCNDLLSYSRERRCGDTTNYVTVFVHELGCGVHDAITRVKQCIAQRVGELHVARERVTQQLEELDLDDQRGQITAVADCYTRIVGTNLAWMFQSSRYSVPA